jgi:hypothetical protein
LVSICETEIALDSTEVGNDSSMSKMEGFDGQYHMATVVAVRPRVGVRRKGTCTKRGKRASTRALSSLAKTTTEFNTPKSSTINVVTFDRDWLPRQNR